MKKYFALFCIPSGTMAQWAQTTDAETQKVQMEKMMVDWEKWIEELGSAVVDKGMPLGKTKRVTKEGVADVKNDLTYYVILQADSHEAAAQMVQNSPHFNMPDVYVEVMEVRGM